MSFKTPEGEAAYRAVYDHNLQQWNVPYERMDVATSYGSTHILAAGSKDLPPLIMLHGAGISSAGWYRNIKPLSSRFRVYALDVLGDMNLSDPSKPFTKGEDMAEWMCEVLDALGIDQASIIGHSAGGYVTLNIAIHAQHRIKRMALLAPAASFIPFRKLFFVKLLSINLIRNESFVNRFFCNWVISKEARHLFDEFGFTRQFFYGILHYQWKVKPVIPAVIPEDKLRTIHVPSLLLMGDEEVIYNPSKAMKRAKQLIPHIEQHWIPKANHLLFMEQPDLVNEHLLRFMAV